MTTQLLMVALIVALAAGYLVRATWKAWKKGKTLCGGCPQVEDKTSAGGGSPFIPLENVKLRRH